MDISLLNLPVDSNRRRPPQFNSLPPDVTNVNINYQPSSDRPRTDDNGSPRKSGSLGRDDTGISEFPKLRKSSVASVDSTQSLSTRDRSRSNASLANEECQQFIQSLKEPKYNKPLTSDEIEWLFQDFYMKMKRDFLASPIIGDDATKRQFEHEVEAMLDRVEKAVAGGELHSKLFHLGDGHDNELNNRLKWFRENVEMRQILRTQLDLGSSPRVERRYSYSSQDERLSGGTNSPSSARSVGGDNGTVGGGDSASTVGGGDSASTVGADTVGADTGTTPLCATSADQHWDPPLQHLNRISREMSPKSKLALIIKAHHALIESLGKSAAADNILPYFIYSLVCSDLDNWWQNFLFIKRFRRSSALVGHASYCLTNFEAAIKFLESFTCADVPDGVDSTVFAKPVANPRSLRERSGSQSSRNSVSSASFSPFNNPLSNRINETFSSYRSMLMTARRPSQTMQLIDQRFLNADPENLTLGDVRVLLREYKRLAEYIENRR